MNICQMTERLDDQMQAKCVRRSQENYLEYGGTSELLRKNLN